ncbi:hypothetical protein BJY59DRAFT_215012 [Rhodotorula toruloides]
MRIRRTSRVERRIRCRHAGQARQSGSASDGLQDTDNAASKHNDDERSAVQGLHASDRGEQHEFTRSVCARLLFRAGLHVASGGKSRSECGARGGQSRRTSCRPTKRTLKASAQMSCSRRVLTSSIRQRSRTLRRVIA